MILDCEKDFDVPIILERPFLFIGRALVDIKIGYIKFRINDEQFTFNTYRSIRKWKNIWVVSMIDTVDEDALIVPIEERLGIEALVVVIMILIAMV